MLCSWDPFISLFQLASLVLLPLARGVGFETEQAALSSHHVLQHSGDSRNLDTSKLYTLSASELGLRVPELQLNHLEKLDSPALCLNTTDPAASHSSLTGKNGGTGTFQILDETSTP